ncbi:MAG: DNA topoisomerase [Lachnospiraceae bacterium]|nr:DNA topoisomerase [Lachnospiraceae bacterium]
MMKNLYIAEKPSVAAQFADALGVKARRGNGFIEDDGHIITWCVGHLVTMCYPEKYDSKLKRWSLETLPFLPAEFKYELIEDVKPQFNIVSKLLNREDVGCIYICTDSGREGEYIYRLVDMMAGVKDKTRKRVWIDSQTQEEILRGIREAKDWSAYDNLSDSAYLRAKEDYLMGINFSRLLTLKYGNTLSAIMKRDKTIISIGRVMTCVLGMVVRREREIRDFVKTPFYRIMADIDGINAEWKVTPDSEYFESSKLYRENGFKTEKDAKELIDKIKTAGVPAELVKSEKKKETKNPPLLYNLAEIQNDCSRKFKISPDETLKIIQELYEKKLVTYPRTDARVLSSAVAKEIGKNLNGISKLPQYSGFTKLISESESWKKIGKSRYTNDSQITDHYAIIPTGQGLNALNSLGTMQTNVYDLIVRRFLSIFYPPAIYDKVAMEFAAGREHFFANFKVLRQSGYLDIVGAEKKSDDDEVAGEAPDIRKGSKLNIRSLEIKEGETTPPKRYNSGSMILAMENAGQLIEDEELRSQIKGSGIGTSATRAEILKKLCTIKYLALNHKTQIITPTLLGEMIYDTVDMSMRQMLNPELTASWEKGLSYVAEGSISSDEYMEKLNTFVAGRCSSVMKLNNQSVLKENYEKIRGSYKKSV